MKFKYKLFIDIVSSGIKETLKRVEHPKHHFNLKFTKTQIKKLTMEHHQSQHSTSSNSSLNKLKLTTRKLQNYRKTAEN